MSISETFESFLKRIAIDNDASISLRYEEITCALNKKFRDTESKTANSLQVGSYGRWTAIKGISDLDMLYIMPQSKWSSYSAGGQSKLLKDCADAISARYPNTTVKVDRLVVRVLYTNFHVEVQPVFENNDKESFSYPDTYGEPSWKVTKPRAEIRAMKEFDTLKNKNLRRLCKMARSWKNKHGVSVGGLLIDTLVHNFLKSTKDYDEKSYLYYDYMCRDFFKYLADLPKQDYFAALGSGQRVKVKKQFHRKAKKAYELSIKAIEAEGTDSQNDRWRKVFGRKFPPAPTQVTKSASIVEGRFTARNTEEFVEDKFPVDVRYAIRLECEVVQNGFRQHLLREMIKLGTPLKAQKTLKFYVESHSIHGDFALFWKVLNRGTEAIERDKVRGQIVKDEGGKSKTEPTTFRGDHIVECYAVQNGVVVATDRIYVPIQ